MIYLHERKRDLFPLLRLPFFDENGEELYIGNIVEVDCEMYSSSNWYRKTHDRHYQKYPIEMQIDFHCNRYRIDYEYKMEIGLFQTQKGIDQEIEYIKPVGRERYPQHLHVPHSFFNRTSLDKETNRCIGIRLVKNVDR